MLEVAVLSEKLSKIMWFYEINGAQEGPVETDIVREKLARGELTTSTLVWREGMAEWTPLGQIPDFQPAGDVGPAASPSFGSPVAQPQPMTPDMLPPQTSGLAITSMILGIVSFGATLICFSGFLFSIPGVICGHIARNQIAKSGGQQLGKGFALAGIITGYVNLALTLAIVIGLAVFAAIGSESLEAEIKAAQEEAESQSPMSLDEFTDPEQLDPNPAL